MKKLFIPAAIVALLGFPFAVIGYRSELFGFSSSYKIMNWTVYLAVAVFFLGMIFTFVKRRSDPAFSKAARTASYLVLIPIIGLGTQVFQARSVPFIHNISTDVVDPPAFVKVVALRTADNNPLGYDIEKLAQTQLAAYPKVKTLLTDLSLSEAHSRALEVVKSKGWELVNSDLEAGLVEATETSLIWGFKDDVVVRITEKDGQRAVDLRSVSRIGQSDLGANAKRIEKFLSAFSKS